MNNDLKIDHQRRGDSGRYVARLPSGVEAEMTYRSGGEHIRIFDHTLVPDEFRGLGIALRLVQAGISDARRDGKKIVPQCSYVAAQFRRHPEWADLLAN